MRTKSDVVAAIMASKLLACFLVVFSIVSLTLTSLVRLMSRVLGGDMVEAPTFWVFTILLAGFIISVMVTSAYGENLP